MNLNADSKDVKNLLKIGILPPLHFLREDAAGRSIAYNWQTSAENCNGISGMPHIILDDVDLEKLTLVTKMTTKQITNLYCSQTIYCS
jgi:hypothetical protein